MLFTGCSSQTDAVRLSRYHPVEKIEYQAFKVCHGYGCRHHSFVYFEKSQWEQAIAPMQSTSSSAEYEREQIAQTIALMEDLVGEAVGTQSDVAGADFIVEDPGQMDCIDETINTSLYLRMIEESGLLHYHTVGEPARRGYFIDGRWPHNTATIYDNATKQRYVVDSWFRENGAVPYILPVEQWLNGWKPQGFKS